MPGFPSYDAVLDALTVAGKGEDYYFNKATITTVANTFWSLWTAAGQPGAGTFGGTPLAARVVNSSTTGALGFTNPTAPDTKHLLALNAASSVAAGTLLVVDRLLDYATISATSTSLQTMDNTATLSRYTTGAGVQMFFEVTTALGATPQTCTITYCADARTECLTKRGWTKYDAIRQDDELLVFDPHTETTRWERPKEVFVEERYDGDMVLLHNEYGLTMLVTPDHRWPVQIRRGRERIKGIEVMRTYDLPKSEGSLLRSARHEAPEIALYSDAFVELAAWYFTEGSLNRDGLGVTLAQSDSVNKENVTRIRSALETLRIRHFSEYEFSPEKEVCAADGCIAVARQGRVGLCGEHYWDRHKQAKEDGIVIDRNRNGKPRRNGWWYSEQHSALAGIVRWNIRGTEVDRLTEVIQGKDKHIDTRFLSALTQPQLALFLDTALRGDGMHEKRLFYQHEDTRMGGYMAAAVLAGYGPSLDKSGTCCALNAGEQISLESLARKTIYYRGPVWCPVTESGHWVARRDGKVFITGNTNQAGTGSRVTTLSPVISSTVPRIPQVGFFVPLAAGDTGVRSVQSCQFGGSMGAGVLALTLCRPFVDLPIQVAAIAVERNLILHTPRAQQIVDNAAFSFLLYAATTSSGALVGSLRAAAR